MEPVTHFLTGACIGRAGLNRKTAYATLVATLAAEAADIDILWEFRGPVAELQHHRGITHTFLGAPFVAAAVLGAVALWHLLRRRHRDQALARSHTLQPVRWGWLALIALIAAYSHILLDWTNNYGVRPFFPFNPRWYAGSFMFIAEPVLWALYLLALIVPWLLGLADREIGARRTRFRGRAWAIFALCGALALGCWRWAEHAEATALLQNTQVTDAPTTRVALEPYPINPFRWHALLETPSFYQTAEVDSRSGSIDSDPQTDIIYKPTDTPALEAAKQTYLGKVYLDWGQWAVVRDLGQVPAPGLDPPHLPPGRAWTTVQFSDLRFAYSFRGGGSTPPPAGLSGWVYIVDNKDEAGQVMSGKEQK